jgi:hypothetical protein
MYCKNCSYCEENEFGQNRCRSPKIAESGNVYASKETDIIQYVNNRGIKHGEYAVGDFFGCVHFKKVESINPQIMELLDKYIEVKIQNALILKDGGYEPVKPEREYLKT